VLAIDDLAARESAERSRLAAHGPGDGRSLLRVLRKSSQANRYSWSAKPEESLEAAIAFARVAKRLDQLDARGFAELGNALLYRRRHGEGRGEADNLSRARPTSSECRIQRVSGRGAVS